MYFFIFASCDPLIKMFHVKGTQQLNLFLNEHVLVCIDKSVDRTNLRVILICYVSNHCDPEIMFCFLFFSITVSEFQSLHFHPTYSLFVLHVVYS